MRKLYIYLTNFYLKIKFKKNITHQIDSNYLQKVKISINEIKREALLRM